MKISGSALLHADVARVYAALNDPATLSAVIPGCERLAQVAPDEYDMVVTVGVGSIKGTYKGHVSLSDKKEPHTFTLNASGAGGPGTVKAVCRMLLVDEDDGTTRVEYDADAVVGGMVAGVGQRMLTGVARKMAAQFFAEVDEALTAPPAAVGESAPAMAGDHGGAMVPPRMPPPAMRPDVVIGAAAVGAAAALAGVIVGWVLGRGSRRG